MTVERDLPVHLIHRWRALWRPPSTARWDLPMQRWAYGGRKRSLWRVRTRPLGALQTPQCYKATNLPLYDDEAAMASRDEESQWQAATKSHNGEPRCGTAMPNKEQRRVALQQSTALRSRDGIRIYDDVRNNDSARRRTKPRRSTN